MQSAQELFCVCARAAYCSWRDRVQSLLTRSVTVNAKYGGSVFPNSPSRLARAV
jgi:hypothetical protein